MSGVDRGYVSATLWVALDLSFKTVVNVSNKGKMRTCLFVFSILGVEVIRLCVHTCLFVSVMSWC